MLAMRRRAHARNSSTCDGLADPARRRKLPKVLLAACVQIARKQRRDAAVGGHAPLFAASTAATLRFPLASHDFELADEGGAFRRVAGRWALVAGGETLGHVDVPPAG